MQMIEYHSNETVEPQDFKHIKTELVSRAAGVHQHPPQPVAVWCLSATKLTAIYSLICHLQTMNDDEMESPPVFCKDRGGLDRCAVAASPLSSHTK